MKIRWIVLMPPFLGAGLLPGQTPAHIHQLVATHNDVSVWIPNSGHIPRWTNNRLAGCDQCEGSPLLYTDDRQGIRDVVRLDVPNAGYTAVYDVAAGSDGSLAAVGLAMSGDSRMGTFIVWISPDRSHQVITRVWPYAPRVVTIAPDGTIWTVGAIVNDNYRQVNPNVLRHYTPAGQLLASTLIRTPKRAAGGRYDVSDTSILMASTDRIGWLTMACQYFEFSFDAIELGRYSCPNGHVNTLDIAGIALSSANDVLIGGKWLAPLAPLQLDRASNTWKPVAVSQDSGNTQMLLGFDGLTLITTKADTPFIRRYVLSDQPPGGGQ